MATPPSKALSAQGYLFHLPSLGLLNLAEQRVQLRVAIGDKKRCTLLLQDLKRRDVLPLLEPSAKEEVVEAELDGVIWSFPTTLAATEGKKLFSVEVRRRPLCSLTIQPPRQRLPSGISAVFLNTATKLFEAVQEEEESASTTTAQIEDDAYAAQGLSSSSSIGGGGPPTPPPSRPQFNENALRAARELLHHLSCNPAAPPSPSPGPRALPPPPPASSAPAAAAATKLLTTTAKESRWPVKPARARKLQSRNSGGGGSSSSGKGKSGWKRKLARTAYDAVFAVTVLFLLTALAHPAGSGSVE